MDRALALDIIRDSFAHVVVERVVVEYDPLFGGEVAKVVVREDQLADALRDNGAPARRAAVRSGLDVEVCWPRTPNQALQPTAGPEVFARVVGSVAPAAAELSDCPISP